VVRLLESGIDVVDKETRSRRRLRPSDVAILGRTNDHAVDYAAALSARGVSVSLEQPGLLATPQVCLRSRDAFWDIQVPKTHSIFDSLLCSDRPAVITIAYRTLQLRCSCTTPS